MMKPIHLCSFRFAFVALAFVSGQFAAPVRADENKPRPKASRPVARSLRLTRIGGSYSPPHFALITFTFAVEGADWAEMQRNEAALLETYRKIVAAHDSADNAVSIENSQSGQTVRDGKLISTNSGVIGVRVRNLAKLKAIGRELARITSNVLTLHYYAGKNERYYEDRAQAQVHAIKEARKHANLLAAAAGTRIVGVKNIQEGEVCSAEAPSDNGYKPELWKIPKMVLVVYAYMTVDFEIAASSGSVSVRTARVKHR